MSEIIGHISQIIGPVIDVYFDTEGKDAEKVLPKIYEALQIQRPDGTPLIVEVQLVPTFVRVERSDTVYAINLGEQRGQHPEGSVFERDYRVVRPFEAYTTHGAAAAAPAFIAIGDLAGGDTGIEGLQAPPDEVKVYSSSGVLLRQGRRDDVLPRLPSGVYVVGGRKQTIR